MEMTIDMEDVEDFVFNTLPKLLNDNNVKFTTSAFILNAILKEIDYVKENGEKINE